MPAVIPGTGSPLFPFGQPLFPDMIHGDRNRWKCAIGTVGYVAPAPGEMGRQWNITETLITARVTEFYPEFYSGEIMVYNYEVSVVEKLRCRRRAGKNRQKH